MTENTEGRKRLVSEGIKTKGNTKENPIVFPTRKEEVASGNKDTAKSNYKLSLIITQVT